MRENTKRADKKTFPREPFVTSRGRKRDLESKEDPWYQLLASIFTHTHTQKTDGETERER